MQGDWLDKEVQSYFFICRTNKAWPKVSKSQCLPPCPSLHASGMFASVVAQGEPASRWVEGAHLRMPGYKQSPTFVLHSRAIDDAT